ncbi:hypothetical protein DFJ63DRAFT_332677 [Scheffersomyces coipomensis]|uniref:uncharacterized protein n=1 Tax=Scheffersomyces coipomensis TaxID=1788519 RepID=UPI00315CF02E
MGLKVTNYFDNSKYETPDLKIITCKGCSSHLCLSSLIVSDNFNGSSGPAYLVDNLINIEYDLNPQKKEMRTGFYLVDDIRCHQCKSNLGWYYKKSYTFRETYKEGKYVIEHSFIKFIDNNTSNNLLIEKALKNKFRRRFSSTSTLSSDELDFNNNSSSSTTTTATINSIDTPSLNHPFAAITTINDPSNSFNKPSLIHYSPTSKIISYDDSMSNQNSFRFIDSSSSPKRKSIDYRNISLNNGLFLNGLRIPVSTTSSSSSSTAAPITPSSSSVDYGTSSSPPTLATIAMAAAAAAAANSSTAASPSSTTASPPSTRSSRPSRRIRDEEDDNDVFVDA